jgi:hypothetical protein
MKKSLIPNISTSFDDRLRSLSIDPSAFSRCSLLAIEIERLQDQLKDMLQETVDCLHSEEPFTKKEARFLDSWIAIEFNKHRPILVDVSVKEER